MGMQAQVILGSIAQVVCTHMMFTFHMGNAMHIHNAADHASVH